MRIARLILTGRSRSDLVEHPFKILSLLACADLAGKVCEAFELLGIVRVEFWLARHAAMVAQSEGRDDRSGLEAARDGAVKKRTVDGARPSVEAVDDAWRSTDLPAKDNQDRGGDEQPSDHDGDGGAHHVNRAGSGGRQVAPASVRAAQKPTEPERALERIGLLPTQASRAGFLGLSKSGYALFLYLRSPISLQTLNRLQQCNDIGAFLEQCVARGDL